MSSSAAAPAGAARTALLSTSATGLSTLTRSSGLEATPASTKGRGVLLRCVRWSGRRFAPSHGVDARVVGINVLAGNVVGVHVVSIDVVGVDVIPVDVVHIHVIPVDVVHVHVVVINVAVDIVVVVDVVVVHIAMHDGGVDVDSAVAVIHVYAVDVNVT